MPVKILLADKSITIQKVVEMLFSGRDYEVTSVSDGEAALTEAARVLPDIVLADVDLPRLDGYALSGRLKQTLRFAQTPVILMMSRDDVYDLARGKDAGIIDNIAKPFESQELIGKVNKALAEAPPKHAETEKAIPIPQSEPLAASPGAAQHAARLSPIASPDMFDIEREAHTETEIEKAASAAVPEEESVYEVELEVEEVTEPPTKETEEAMPGGDKAVDEIQVGLGLTSQPVDTAPEIIPYESFEIATEKAAKEVVSTPLPNSSNPAMTTETASVSTMLPAGELRKIAEETIAKMAKEMLSQMQPIQPPKISDELVRSVIEEAAAKMLKEAFEVKPPQISEDMLRGIVEENVLKVVNETVGKMTIPKPPTLPESELRAMAEATLNSMALEAFKNLPPPPIPKISDEEVRKGLESVVSQVVREMAKEVIEQVAWEVIPQLAEYLIKEEIERLKAET
jgi:CheY-like chemotaxis protein